MSKKIVTVVGARPQFIKAATVSRELKKAGVNEVIIHTGQHFDDNMSKIFFDEMEIPQPDYHLDIHSLSHGAMTGRMIEKIEKVLVKESPDYLIVYGDTNSTLAGAIAAQKLQIPIAHVEAGLRSFNMSMPEETNRILTDRISRLLFCPSDYAVENLKNEGFDKFPCKIVRSGDVMQDAALFYNAKAMQKSTIIKKLNLENSKFILCTVHRQENTDDQARLENIISSLNELSKKFQVILPLHPRTKEIIKKTSQHLHFKPIDPVGYFDMIQLIKNSEFVMTDSGGLQKEAFFFKKFCITLRDETEWIELAEHGFNAIVGANQDQILSEAKNISQKSANFDIDLYGQGKAAENIVRVLLKD